MKINRFKIVRNVHQVIIKFTGITCGKYRLRQNCKGCDVDFLRASHKYIAN